MGIGRQWISGGIKSLYNFDIESQINTCFTIGIAERKEGARCLINIPNPLFQLRSWRCGHSEMLLNSNSPHI